MRTYTYKFTSNTGDHYLIEEATRIDAVNKLSEQTGIPVYFIKAHFLCKNLGRSASE